MSEREFPLTPAAPQPEDFRQSRQSWALLHANYKVSSDEKLATQ
jgi:hypothetical protein